MREDLWRDLRALRETHGTTIVLTTHLMDEAEACDRVAILDGGRVVLSGRPRDLTAALGGDIITIETDRADAAGRAASASDSRCRRPSWMASCGSNAIAPTSSSAR